MFEAPEDTVFLSHFLFDIDQSFDNHQRGQVLCFRPLDDSGKVLGGGLHSQCFKFFDDGIHVLFIHGRASFSGYSRHIRQAMVRPTGSCLVLRF